jgi:hypothetical protein
MIARAGIKSIYQPSEKNTDHKADHYLPGQRDLWQFHILCFAPLQPGQNKLSKENRGIFEILADMSPIWYFW